MSKICGLILLRRSIIFDAGAMHCTVTGGT
jgi:hypothetical protein